MFRKVLAFTMVEAVIAVAVFGILGSIVLVSVNQNRLKQARDAVRKNDLKVLREGLHFYFLDKESKYPKDCISLCTRQEFYSNDGIRWIQGLTADYIKELPVDPKQGSALPSPAPPPLPPPPGPTTVGISANFDGRYRQPTTNGGFNDCINGTTANLAGRDNTTYNRHMGTYMRFPLDSLLTGKTVTKVELKVNITQIIKNPDVDGNNIYVDVEPFYVTVGLEGQLNPEGYSCSTGIPWASAHQPPDPEKPPYLEGLTGADFQAPGIYTFLLPAVANTHVQNAKANGNFFSMAISHHHGSISGNYISIEAIERVADIDCPSPCGSDEPKLIITYEDAPLPPPPPPCDSGPNYTYVVDAARENYALWACLEYPLDEHIYKEGSNPICDDLNMKPLFGIYNYCVTAPY